MRKLAQSGHIWPSMRRLGPWRASNAPPAKKSLHRWAELMLLQQNDLALSWDAEQGPLINTPELVKVARHVQDTLNEGATCHVPCEGKHHVLCGILCTSTVITEAKADMDMAPIANQQGTYVPPVLPCSSQGFLTR